MSVDCKHRQSTLQGGQLLRKGHISGEVDAAVREAGTTNMLVDLQKALWAIIKSTSLAAASRCMLGKKQ